MRQKIKRALVGVVGVSALAVAAAGAATPAAYRDQVEMLDWSDPERAAQLLDASPAPAELHPSDLQMLEVRGMVYADVHRDADADAIVERMNALAERGDRSAARAAHYVRAYSFYQRDQYSAANAELSHIDVESIEAMSERYRFSILRGNSLRLLGKAEAALPYLERSLDLAHEMRDERRSLHAMLWLARIYSNTGNYERASSELDIAQQLANKLGDEAASSTSKAAARISQTGRADVPRSGVRASRRSITPGVRAAASGSRMPSSTSVIRI